MISKITAILAAAVVLASAGVASAQTVYAPYANSYYNQDTRNLASGTQTTRSLTPMPGRCGRTLRRTKFCANCSGSFFRTISRMAAAPSALLQSG